MPPTLTDIDLLKPHRHAGRDYQPGHRIRLPAAKADWLIGIGVAKAAPAEPAKAAPAEPAKAAKG
jgi:hypothetical protein